MSGHRRLRRIRVAAAATALLLPLAAAVSLGAPAQAAGGHGSHPQPRYERVAYFTQWGIYGADFHVRDLVTNGSARRLTVLNYAFGNVSSDAVCVESTVPGEADPWADYQVSFTADQSVDGIADAPGQALAGNFNQIRKLKKRYPGLRTQISLGGWTWSKYFSDAALTPASRRKLVASCIDLYLKGNLPMLGGDPHGGTGAAAGVFDGIDIDWEWPANEGNPGNVVRPEDKRNFTLMLAEFRRQLDALGRANHKHYSLTAFLAADPAQIETGLEVPKISRYLDFATLQGYDLHGTWEDTTNHQSALFSPKGDPSPQKFSVDQTVRAYLAHGMPPSKIVIGVPFYGYGWTGVTNANHGLFQQSTGPAQGHAEAGIEDYKRLKALPGFTRYRDVRAGFAWLFDGTTFWTIDDPIVMYEKAFYIRARGLRGVMAWSLDSDDGSLLAALDRGLG
jgi:chitinase